MNEKELEKIEEFKRHYGIHYVAFGTYTTMDENMRKHFTIQYGSELIKTSDLLDFIDKTTLNK